MGKQSLVIVDTNHIKQYVFPTDKLTEIRGASSILDHLNRRVMKDVAKEFNADIVYTNGGSGLFLVNGDKKLAEQFGLRVQREYHTTSKGGASITFAVEEIPDRIKDPWHEPLRETLDLLHFHLAEKKNCPPSFIALPSHPFLRMCDACGLRYAETSDPSERRDPASRDNRYCAVCRKKREEDDEVKGGIDALIEQRTKADTGGTTKPEKPPPFAWEKLLDPKKLPPNEYKIPPKTERPPDFNELRGMAGGKDYLALIYADGNGMGQVMEEIETLAEMKVAAETIDDAVYKALREAVKKHLQVIPGDEAKKLPPRFPFDLLLVGGDDMLIVTPAASALDVALIIAKTFYQQAVMAFTDGGQPRQKQLSLAIGIVLAPAKYPFGQLEDLAEETLKFAKTEGAKRLKESAYGDTFINFMVVTGSTSQDFKKVYASLREKDGSIRVNGGRKRVQFYATLRPYTVEQLEEMLRIIREGKGKALGRTKLQQVREAVLQMNLTSSVTEGLGVLRNWRPKQRDFVLEHVYTLGGHYQERYRDESRPETLFPRVTFPWFADGDETYRTSLLDFVELYDFVAQDASGPGTREGGDDAN